MPKTIDNDLSGTDYTFGFDTAVAICTEAIDRLHTTAESHNRVMVVEVMGRHTGWIAVHSGIAGGADVILIPERPVDLDEVTRELHRRHSSGKNFSIVVVSEGCELPGAEDKGEVDQFGHKLLAKRGVGDRLGEEIESRTGFETRVTVLGHVQRGGSPTAYDRILATRFGLKAADLVEARRVRPDGVAARQRRRLGLAARGDRRAEDGDGRLVRRRARVLRLTDAQSSASGKLRCRRGGTMKFWRCVVESTELKPCSRARGLNGIFPPGSTPSIARRLRRKSSPVGLKTTKWTPAAGSAPISSARSDHANGLSSVLKSARTGIAVPFRVHRPVLGDVIRLQPRRRLDRRAVADSPGAPVVTTHVRLGRDVLRALPHRLRSLAALQVRPERRRDALVEVEVEVPRLDVLVDVRQVHVRAVTEVVAVAQVDVAERLEVRDRPRPHAGLLGRREPEEELGGVGDQVGARDLRRLRELLRQRASAVEAAACEAAADRRRA